MMSAAPVTLASLLLSPSLAMAASLAPPNFVLHFIDDTGYGDYGFNVATDDTPRLTAAAKRGMVLSDFHAAASVCTPSRSGLLTGRLGLRTGVVRNFGPPSLHGLALNETTIAELLSANGHRTAMAGKWHLGHRPPHSPLHRGFDDFLGLPMSHDYGCTDRPGYDISCPHRAADVCRPSSPADADGPDCHIGPHNPWNESIPLYRGDTIIEQPTDLWVLAQRYAAFGADFIKTSAAAAKPFFLYIAWNHMHVPIGNHDPKFTNTSARGPYGDTLRQLDESIGVVLDALGDARVEENTLIVLTGDNGAPDDQCSYGGSNAPFVGGWLPAQYGGGGTGKTTTWEGGHREPGLAIWPGRIPAGARSEATVSALDVFPTFAALAGIRLPAGRVYDGVDLSQVLLAGARAPPPRPAGALFHPNSGGEGQIGDLETVRLAGDLADLVAKYRTGGKLPSCDGRRAPDAYHDPPLVFDLRNDPGQTAPLGAADARHARAVAAAAEALRRIRASIAADNTTVSSYATDDRARPCCGPKEPLCRCPHQVEGY